MLEIQLFEISCISHRRICNPIRNYKGSRSNQSTKKNKRKENERNKSCKKFFSLSCRYHSRLKGAPRRSCGDAVGVRQDISNRSGFDSFKRYASFARNMNTIYIYRTHVSLRQEEWETITIDAGAEERNRFAPQPGTRIDVAPRSLVVTFFFISEYRAKIEKRRGGETVLPFFSDKRQILRVAVVVLRRAPRLLA